MACNRHDSWVLDLCCDCSDVDQQVLARVKSSAIGHIDRITRGQYGTCDLLGVRPCIGYCDRRCMVCSTCRFERIDLLPLAGYVDSILEIRRDGVVVEDTQYQLLSHRYLAPFIPGTLYPWPWQDLAVVPSALEVDIRSGQAVPDEVLMAASDLACQFIALCTNRACDIPSNAVSVTREGVTIRLDTGLDAVPSVKMLRQQYAKDEPRPPQIGRKIFDPARFPAGQVPS